ncbi:hypothetical protein [Vibrio owensii]|uniref:Uncharacterized protein n=1 Tax=Vibrio owensii CAIM 1854 = LMG 25443 TaxID=1229493 RepID=A0A0C1Z1E6_9VIBR|nr:hypothetical protein [Vibrio owensii]KIF50945.1 hypothetical protein H735_21820 [Vibrio owensii CAIM 1854 = LMG 25443]
MLSSNERAKKVVLQYCKQTGFLIPQSNAAQTLEALISEALDQHVYEAFHSKTKPRKKSALEEFKTKFADYLGDDGLNDE